MEPRNEAKRCTANVFHRESEVMIFISITLYNRCHDRTGKFAGKVRKRSENASLSKMAANNRRSAVDDAVSSLNRSTGTESE